MILMANPSRRPLRLAFWIVLIPAALLLPLAPRAARTEAPEEPAPKESPRQESAKRPPAAAERDRGEEIEKLQDEIELLKLKVQLKDVRRKGTQKKLEEVQRRLQHMIESNRRHPGTIPADTLGEHRITEAGLTADAAVQEIEWKEATLLLKQAERRLARLQRPAEKTEGGGRAQQEKRLRELEQRVENLLKEIHKMRKDMQPDKPRDQGLVPREAREFIDRVWPTLDTARLGDNISKAQAAFQICKNVGDRISLRKLLNGTEGHADRLTKELTKLKPELIIDDVKPARKLQRVSAEVIKLGTDIQEYLKAHADDK
ncbi:MAG TPA: hypothetical protein VMG10_18210 [Gemmataceae bacterium]|nr:hypothetical protein [Gemmataceae bacterium]